MLEADLLTEKSFRVRSLEWETAEVRDSFFSSREGLKDDSTSSQS